MNQIPITRVLKPFVLNLGGSSCVLIGRSVAIGGGGGEGTPAENILSATDDGSRRQIVFVVSENI